MSLIYKQSTKIDEYYPTLRKIDWENIKHHYDMALLPIQHADEMSYPIASIALVEILKAKGTKCAGRDELGLTYSECPDLVHQSGGFDILDGIVIYIFSPVALNLLSNFLYDKIFQNNERVRDAEIIWDSDDGKLTIAMGEIDSNTFAEISNQIINQHSRK